MNDYYKCPKCNNLLLSRRTVLIGRDSIKVEQFVCPHCGCFQKAKE